MLASTVQFSNNDQPPTTPPTTGEFTGAGNRRTQTSARTFRYPTACPTRSIQILYSTPKQYSQVPINRAE